MSFGPCGTSMMKLFRKIAENCFCKKLHHKYYKTGSLRVREPSKNGNLTKKFLLDQVVAT